MPIGVWGIQQSYVCVCRDGDVDPCKFSHNRCMVLMAFMVGSMVFMAFMVCVAFMVFTAVVMVVDTGIAQE